LSFFNKTVYWFNGYWLSK